MSSINPGLIVRPRGRFQDLAEVDHDDSYVGNNLALREFDYRFLEQTWQPHRLIINIPKDVASLDRYPD